MKRLVVKFLDHSCRVYTVTAVLLLLLQMAMEGGADETVIRPEAFMLVLPFAFGFALADLIYAWRGASHVVRLAIHFVVVVLCAFFFLYLPIAGAGSATSQKVTFLLILAVLYWLCMGIYLAIASSLRRAENAKKDYKESFKKNNK